MYNYAVIDSLAKDVYREAIGSYGGFNSGDEMLEDLLQLRQVLMATNTFELCCRLRA
jgi:hypothetical protein